MKEIRKTSQFKKDYKRFKNDKEFIAYGDSLERRMACTVFIRPFRKEKVWAALYASPILRL